MPDDAAVNKKIDDYRHRIEKINERMEKLKAQKESILMREKEKARKARTRRLIQNGDLAEQYLDCNDMPPELFEKYLSGLAGQRGYKDYVEAFKSSIGGINKNG
jgi:predicted phage gp36 major capsid-like protein